MGEVPPDGASPAPFPGGPAQGWGASGPAFPVLWFTRAALEVPQGSCPVRRARAPPKPPLGGRRPWLRTTGPVGAPRSCGPAPPGGSLQFSAAANPRAGLRGAGPASETLTRRNEGRKRGASEGPGPGRHGAGRDASSSSTRLWFQWREKRGIWRPKRFLEAWLGRDSERPGGVD